MNRLIIAAVSDIHQRLEILPRLGPCLEQADLLLLLGDLTQFGHAPEALRVLRAFQGLISRILALPGNLDHPDVLALLRDENVSLHDTQVVIGPVGLAGLGGSSPTPFGTPFELPEPVISEALRRGLEAIRTARWRILASHAPPARTGVDRVRFGLHAGSASVRRAVEERQPDLVLCGHIHEAAGEDRLGPTRLFNPGPLHRGGYVWIEADDDALRVELRQVP